MAVCALLAKMIGALYRIPLTNIVGAEGIGLYQMVFPLYTVLLTVSSGGLPVAISKVVSEKRAKGDEAGARQVLFVSLLSLTLAGAACALIIVLFRGRIAFVQGNIKAALPYLGIAPSLIFVAVISSFRGYFQGMQNMLPSALSQLIEQSVKLAAGLYFAGLFLQYSLELAVLGALVGVSLSELAAMTVLIVQFLIADRKFKKRSRISFSKLSTEAAADIGSIATFKPKNRSQLLREIYKVAIPVTLGSLVMPLTQVIDSILVINLLVSGGAQRAAATSLFGLVTGPINSLINMPVVITLSLAVSLLPRVAECFSGGCDPSEAVGQSLKYSFIIGLLSTLVLGVFAKPLFSLLYSGGLSKTEIATGAALLSMGSISVLYVSVLQIATSVLQGVNLAHKPALNLMYGALFKVVFTLVLLPLFGVAGAMASTVLCYGLTCILDVASMLKYVRPKLKFFEFIGAPLLSGAAFVGVGSLLVRLFSRFLGAITALIGALVIAGVVFVLFLILLGAIKRDELKELPGVGKLIKKIGARKKMRKEKAARKNA